MELTPNQGRLEAVYLLAATLADRMLTKQLSQSSMPLANADALRKASFLLDEYEYPVPSIVVDVLGRIRHAENAGKGAEGAINVGQSRLPTSPVRRATTLSQMYRPL
jgi:hypothetical protein